jgi:transposase
MQYQPIKLGIDIAKESFDCFLKAGKKGKAKKFQNDATGYRELKRWLEKEGVKEIHASMESTGNYWVALAEELVKAGQQVSVINALQIKRYRDYGKLHGNKTDKADAQLIAEYSEKEEERLRLWEIPNEKSRHLRALVRLMDDIKGDLTRTRNRIASIVTDGMVLASLKRVQANYEGEIKIVEAEIKKVVSQDPELKRKYGLLRSIHGVGDKTATRFLADFPDLSLFRTHAQLVAFMGLNPTKAESGTSVRGPTKISKQGNSQWRAALWFPCIAAIRKNPIVSSLSERMLASGHAKMEVKIAAMRKLVVQMYGVLKSGKPFDPVNGRNIALSS